MFVKMFKPEESADVQTVESIVAPELSATQQQEAKGLISEMIKRFDNIISH